MHELNDSPVKRDWTAPIWLIPALAVVLAATTVWSLAALVHERNRTGTLDSENKTLAANLNGVQSQVRTLSSQLDTLSSNLHAEKQQVTARETVPEQLSIQPIPPATANAKRLAPRRVQTKLASKPAVVNDPRIDEVQARLREHDKELTDTRQQLDKTRQDLEGNLNSAKDELNGSLARTNDSLGRTNDTVARSHEELVELQKRGERNYYEFSLDKSKQFQRVGPLSLSLRKANTKRRSFDFEMMVDDQKLQKKNVNLFEPVVIMTPDRGQALQLVVNQVNKDVVKGYISEPKYKSPQVASATTSSASAALQQRPE
jgi:peptidoglycan hydrolase CwlO-like protein